MKAYTRTTRRKTRQPDQHHNPTNSKGQPTKASPIANLAELVKRKSLVRLQTGFAGLLRTRERMSRELATARTLGDTERAALKARKLSGIELKLQNVAAEIAERMAKPAEPVKPKANRQTRNTKAHSKVRHITKASETAKAKA